MRIRRNIVLSEDDDRYSKTYIRPVVPDGYRKIEGTTWRTGFQIERIEDGSLFEFVPVGALKGNGTLNGKKFNEKFGRRRFYPSNPDELGEEPIYGTTNLLWNQLQSVREYGGFYVSYPISRTQHMKPISIPGKAPWVMVDFDRAMHLANSFEKSPNISSHLLFGAEYDSLIEYLVESGKLSIEEVTGRPQRYEYTQSKEVLGLGKVAEWTQERASKGRVAVRGATLQTNGEKNPIASRRETSKYIKRPYIGFRIALFIPIF